MVGDEGSHSEGKMGSEVGWGFKCWATVALVGSLCPSGSLAPVFPSPEWAKQAVPLLCAYFLRSRGRGKQANWVHGV